MTTFRIGGVCSERGSKKTGFISVTETATSRVEMPVVIINGSEPGPKVCLTAGVHGGEYAGIEAVIRAINTIKPEELSGIVYAIPIVNMTAFESRGPQGGLSTAFHCPIDRLNVNRVFPGHPDGTASHRIAYVLLNEVVAKCDYYMDFHGGDLCEDIFDHVIIPRTGMEEIDEPCREILAPSFNCEMVSVTNLVDEASYWKEGVTTGTTSTMGAAAKIHKIPSLTSESGRYGRLIEEDIRFHFEGIINVLKNLEMMDGPKFKAQRQVSRTSYQVGAKNGGLFYDLALDKRVKKDQVIGEIRDVFGELKTTIKSPADGILSFRRAIFPCSRGDRLFTIFPDEEPATPPPSLPYP
jgi:predicted deacylase